MLKKIFLFLAFTVFPVAAFFAGYRLTDHFFQVRKVPYPFEFFGVAYGLGAASCTLAVILFVMTLIGRVKNRKKAAYVVRENQKINEIEIMK